MARTPLLAGVGERIGAAVARRFHDAGWNVALVSRAGDVADLLADELDRSVAFRADVTDETAVEDAVPSDLLLDAP